MTDENVTLYVRMLAVQIRLLPLSDAVPFLKGALEVAGEHPAMKDLRGTFRDLASADDQLELLASAQLKLDLGGNGKDGQ